VGWANVAGTPQMTTQRQCERSGSAAIQGFFTLSPNIQL
jgi:hypothetical protein